MTTTTYSATLRLMQQDGVTGPSTTVQVESVRHAKEIAFEWSMGELGNPLDLVTIHIPELDTMIEMSLADETIRAQGDWL